MSPGDRSDKRVQKPLSPPHKLGESSEESTRIGRQFAQQLVMELDHFKMLASTVLRESIDCLTSFRGGVTSGTWEDHEPEIRELFTDLRKALSNVSSLDEFKRTSKENLFKKVGQSSFIAHQIDQLTTRCFDLAEKILTTTHESRRTQAETAGEILDDECQVSYESNLDRVTTLRWASRATLRLFFDRDSNNPPVSILDLLAGCSFAGFGVLPGGSATEVGGNQLRHQIGMRSQLAAAGVNLALTCVRDTFERLFEICVRSLIPAEVNDKADYGCATGETVDILQQMCVGGDDPRILALHAIAAEARPVCAYEVTGGAVLSFRLPRVCSVFDEAIKQSLDEILSAATTTFDILEIQAMMFTKEAENWYEVGVRLPIKTEVWQEEIHKETRYLIERLGQEVHDADPVPISFWIQDEGSSCDFGVRAIVPREFFDSPVYNDMLAPNTRLQLVGDTLQHAQQLFGDGAEISFQWHRNPEVGSPPDDYLFVIRDESRYLRPLYDGDLEEVSNQVEFLSINPRATRAPSLNNGVTPTFVCPGDWMQGTAVIDELKKLSTYLTINRINLFDFQSCTADGSPEEGAKMLRKLRETIELEEERLEPFKKPQLSIIAGFNTAQNQPVIPFYLTNKSQELCGFGKLLPHSEDSVITILPKNIVEKFGDLVDAIMDSQEAMKSHVGPWQMRLQTELMSRNFGISDEIATALRQRRAMQQQDLSLDEVTKILCGEITRLSNLTISEHLRLRDREPFTLAITTSFDRYLWDV